MSPEELQQYAATLVLEHAQTIEFMTVIEMAEDNVEGGEISEADAKAVHDLTSAAIVTVTFPGCDLEWSNTEDED